MAVLQVPQLKVLLLADSGYLQIVRVGVAACSLHQCINQS